MSIIECTGLSKDWAGIPVLDRVSLAVESGEKLGLVGRNGCGKTSLLRILAGLDADWRGRLARAPGVRIGLVPQLWEAPEGLSCLQVLTQGAEKARAGMEHLGELLASAAGGTAAQRRLLAEFGEAQAGWEALGGAGADEAARRLLARAGLGSQADTPASAISGGEKNVLALAAALAGKPDLLLLDEPGNHLDFAGLAWLEEFIRGERCAVLMVSHNRYLLDRCVDALFELEGGRLERYAGGFSSYRLQKLSRAAGQGKEWQADRRRVERLEALVRRFEEIARSRPDPAWGKRLRARRSQLGRERASAAERPDLGGGRMSVDFGDGGSRADYALIVRGYRKAWGGRVLLDGAGMDLLAGERAAIVGPNGCGKTSFVRDIAAAEGTWDEGGPIRMGPSMRLGYCAQEQEVLSPGRSVAEEFDALGARPDEAWRLLKRYLFDRDVLEKRVGDLSGGERNRLQIARAVFLGANFLLLDEPTNHLDIEGREALEEGLADFEGTILAVSHDRWFIEKIADRIILIEEGRLVHYEGSFGEYWRDIGSDRARGARGRRRQGAGIEGRGAALRPGHGAGDGAIEARRLVLEGRITALERRKEELERASAAATMARDFAAGGRSAREAAEAGRTLDRLYGELGALE